MEIHQLKEIPIKSILSKFGIEPQRIVRNQAWYYAIDRNEKTPSFKVDLQKNRFFDFGTFHGGSVIDIVMKLKDCKFMDAVDILQNFDGINSSAIKIKTAERIRQPKFKIIQNSELNNSKLLNYLIERKIDIAIAKKYCCQLYYQVNSKFYFAIGFQNDLKGFEIRNPFFKGSTSPKTISSLINQSKQLIIFEGFMDFLSYATYFQLKHLSYDFIILNSVSFYKKIDLNVIEKYDLVFLFLDNDSAGRNATKQLLKLGGKVKDFSYKYKPYNDFNDFLNKKNII